MFCLVFVCGGICCGMGVGRLWGLAVFVCGWFRWAFGAARPESGEARHDALCHVGVHATTFFWVFVSCGLSEVCVSVCFD